MWDILSWMKLISFNFDGQMRLMHKYKETKHRGVGATTDSRQLLDSRVHSSLVVAYSRVHHTRVYDVL